MLFLRQAEKRVQVLLTDPLDSSEMFTPSVTWQTASDWKCSIDLQSRSRRGTDHIPSIILLLRTVGFLIKAGISHHGTPIFPFSVTDHALMRNEPIHTSRVSHPITEHGWVQLHSSRTFSQVSFCGLKRRYEICCMLPEKNRHKISWLHNDDVIKKKQLKSQQGTQKGAWM